MLCQWPLFALMYGQLLAHFLHLLPAILRQDGALHVDFFPSQNTSSQSSNAPTMRTLTRVSQRNNFFATAADIVFVFDCHFLHLSKNLFNHIFRKSLRLFTFLDTDFILQSEKKCGTMVKLYDKVQHSVLLSSRRTPSCNSVSFLFLTKCDYQRTNQDYTQRRP